MKLDINTWDATDIATQFAAHDAIDDAIRDATDIAIRIIAPNVTNTRYIITSIGIIINEVIDGLG